MVVVDSFEDEDVKHKVEFFPGDNKIAEDIVRGF